MTATNDILVPVDRWSAAEQGNDAGHHQGPPAGPA